MPCVIYCDRAPFPVKHSAGEAANMIHDAETDAEFAFWFFDRLHADDEQVALRLSAITSIVPIT